MEKEQFETFLGEIREKLDLVLGGHEVLRADIERARQESRERDEHLLFLIQALNDKIDRVGKTLEEVKEDLAAHRRDTEVHLPRPARGA